MGYTYFDARVHDALLLRKLPNSSGVTTQFDNVGRLSNNGYEAKPWPTARILIGESLPCQLGSLLIGHTTPMVQAAGWSSVKKGEFLRRAAAARSDEFVTPDRKLEYPQHMPLVGVTVVVFCAHSNRIEDLAPLVPALLSVLPTVRVCTGTHDGVKLSAALGERGNCVRRSPGVRCSRCEGADASLALAYASAAARRVSRRTQHRWATCTPRSIPVAPLQ